jgi:putative transposase
MTANTSIDPAQFLAEHLEQAEPDLPRSMVATFVQALMGAEADAVCGASYGARDVERVNTRNGYRPREWDTRAGTIEVEIPKLRSGSYFPDWLLARRRRAERALTTVVATCYLLGVSTRRMEKLVQTLGITSLSRSQVSVMAAELDEQVESFRNRPLDAGPYTFVAADATPRGRVQGGLGKAGSAARRGAEHRYCGGCLCTGDLPASGTVVSVGGWWRSSASTRGVTIPRATRRRRPG